MPKKLFLSLFLILTVSAQSLFAQTLYQIVFKNSDVTYKAFLVYYNEEEAFMRIGYTYEGKYNVVHTDYTSKTGRKGNDEYFIMIGSNPRFITQRDKGQSYNPDHFIWIWNRNESAGLPYVSEDPNFNPRNLLLCSEYREIEASELTDKFLRQYFRTDEPEFKSLTRMMLAATGNLSSGNSTNSGGNWNNNTNSGGSGGSIGGSFGGGKTNTNQSGTSSTNNQNNTKPATLHLVLITNTEIPDIGFSCSVDQKTMDTEFREISKALKINFKKYLVSGEAFTKEKVESTMRDLYPSSNDIVVFYYSGHGFRWSNQTDPYPFLDMRYSDYSRIDGNTSIALSDVARVVSGKGARLNLILSDCCNADVGRNQVTSATFMAGRSFQGAEIEKLRKLFLDARGTMTMTGSSPGEYSWCNVKGGFFTLSFIESLKEEVGFMRNENPSWRHIQENTVKHTKNKAMNGTGSSQIPFCRSSIVQN